MTHTNDKKLNVLFIDNYDSFVFNLVDEFEKRGCAVSVWRNDMDLATAIGLAANIPRPGMMVLSPGPGTPSEAGCCVELVKRAQKNLPIFGVCLGHQAIVEALGGIVGPASEIVHGKATQIAHTGSGAVFEGLDSPMSVGRYHSLIAQPAIAHLATTATGGGMVMAVEHVTRPLVGVQFHPESILTPAGGKMIDNVIRWASGQGEEG